MRWFWFDRFTEYVAGSHAVADKAVSLSDDLLHDHWEGYPVMPNSLIAEGMAQTAGLLVSELYGFKELVVLAKFTRLEFDGPLLPGQAISYHAKIGHRKEIGAQAVVTGTVGGRDGAGGRRQAKAEIFFARIANDNAPESGLPARLFDPEDLCHWLHITGVFRVGRRQDGSRLQPADYGLPVYQ